MTTTTAPTAAAPTLLFVDDEGSILSSLRRLFRPHGYRILLAESGAAGLEILGREPVDLVVSDMRMPEMDGAAFLAEVRRRHPEVVRILLTGYADISSTIEAINQGEIYRYVSKPWDDNDILLIVRHALEQKQLRDENARLLALTQAQNEELRELNATLEERVRQRTAEVRQVNAFLEVANDRLKQNFLTSIKVFSGLMELREGKVGGHARRVADLARKLAIQLKLDGKAQQDVFVAGLLHDIGKIGFSDAMLTKPVPRLGGEEATRYRRHTIAGSNALMPLPDLKGVADLIRSHHERFDGQGFPDGMVGENIPLGARILAVANDYDGLQSGTLAERRLGPDDARDALVKSRGKRYCPQVIDALTELLGKPREARADEREIPVHQLEAGMVLARDLVARDGTLLLAADYVLDANLVRGIQHHAMSEGIALTLHVRTERPPASNPGGKN